MSFFRWGDQSEPIGAPVVVASHPRSGTHLTLDLIRKQFAACQGWLWFGETLHNLYLSLGRLEPSNSAHLSIEEAKDLLRRADRPVVKTHHEPDLAELPDPQRSFARSLLDQGDVLYVVRDGRDVLASMHTWLQELREEARCPFREFIRQEQDGASWVRRWAQHVEAWRDVPGVRLFRFEEIVGQPEVAIRELGDYLDLEPQYRTPYLPARVTDASRWADYWRRLTRQFESTAIPGRYRGREPVDWERALSQEDRAFFHEEAGETLVRLGYEDGDAWVYREHPRKEEV
jgi:hypothetical protein